MESLLSVCIPTYNRSKLLDYNLNALLKWIGDYQVSVYISDNCSFDDTKNVVAKYQKIYRNIFYYRQKRNIGADANFEYVLKWSSSKYSWLLSDDDCIAQKYVENIVETLKNNDIDMCVLNAANRVKDIDTGFFDDKNKLLSQIGWHMQYMSCLIYSRKMIENANFKKYRNTNLIQFGIIFDYLGNRKSIKVAWNSSEIISQISIDIKRNNNDGWSKYTFQIFLKQWTDVIEGLSDEYTTYSKKRCIMLHGINSGLFSFSNLCRLRANGIYNKNVLRKYKPYIKKCINYSWPTLYILAYGVPSSWLMVLKKLKHILGR